MPKMSLLPGQFRSVVVATTAVPGRRGLRIDVASATWDTARRRVLPLLLGLVALWQDLAYLHAHLAHTTPDPHTTALLLTANPLAGSATLPSGLLRGPTS
jgi:hypothetical protein